MKPSTRRIALVIGARTQRPGLRLLPGTGGLCGHRARAPGRGRRRRGERGVSPGVSQLGGQLHGEPAGAARDGGDAAARAWLAHPGAADRQLPAAGRRPLPQGWRRPGAHAGPSSRSSLRKTPSGCRTTARCSTASATSAARAVAADASGPGRADALGHARPAPGARIRQPFGRATARPARPVQRERSRFPRRLVRGRAGAGRAGLRRRGRQPAQPVDPGLSLCAAASHHRRRLGRRPVTGYASARPIRIRCTSLVPS
jgi:hypothetical protein